MRGPAFFAYADNYLIDVKFGIIMDVKATRAIRQAEVAAAKSMIERTQERFNIKPTYLAADTAYGSVETLNWIVNEKKIAPHIPVIDKSKREDGTFSREDFRPARCCKRPEPYMTVLCFAVSVPLRRSAAPICLNDRFLAISTKTHVMSLVPSPRPRHSSDHDVIASASRCCLHIPSASCGSAGFGCAAHVVRKMSLRLPVSRRTYHALQSSSFDRHQWPMRVSRDQCRRQRSRIRCVPLPKRGMIRCRSNKIGTSRQFGFMP
jgi:hypothetical protein